MASSCGSKREDTTLALIGLGSNLGDRRQWLRQAVSRIASANGVYIERCSSVYRTSPIGGPAGQGEFLNAAVLLESTLTAEELWRVLADIEQQLERRREQRWGERTIDLDLLLFGAECRHSAELTIPHPRLPWRRFALVPGAEIADRLVHPEFGVGLVDLLRHLESAPRMMWLAGGTEGKRQALLSHLAGRCQGIAIRDSSQSGGGSIPGGLAIESDPLRLPMAIVELDQPLSPRAGNASSAGNCDLAAVASSPVPILRLSSTDLMAAAREIEAACAAAVGECRRMDGVTLWEPA